ncbi:unnamed protein product [Closterium sp. NIES-54]
MVQQVLQRFGFTYSSPQSTPLPTGHSLSAPPSDESVEPSGPYPELVGCLMYLMTCTRPDLAYPLSLLARYVAPGRHRKVHWDAAKRVLRYLCSTSGMGLVLGGRARVVLTGHADASWVDDLATQWSSQGYTFSLGSGSVSWRSTRSSSVLSSSCEAEIYAGAMAAQELRWLTYLLTDLGEVPRSPPVLYVDNKAMLPLCQEHRLEHRTKHIALRYFLARELQQRGQLRLAYVASQANTADVFTKALQPCDHQRFCTVLGLVVFTVLLAFLYITLHVNWPFGPLLVLGLCGDFVIHPELALLFVTGLPRGAESEGAETGGAEPGDVETGGAEPGGVATGGAEPEGVEPGGATSEGAESGASGAGGAGPARAGGPGVAAGAGVPGGARTRGTGGAGTGGVEGTGAGDLTESGTTGAGGAGARGAGVGGNSIGAAIVGGPGVGGAGARGAGAADTGGVVRPRSYFVPLLQQFLGTPPSAALTPPLLCPPPDRSQPPLQPASPLPAPSPYTDPTVSRLLATAFTDPSFESAAASALIAELLDLAAACSLDYATALVADSASASPPSVGGECALGTDVLEDRQEDFEYLAVAVPRFASMPLAPEGDPDAPDIPTPRSYAEAITGPYSSQWQAAMDAEMASWKSTGTYVDEVPPPGANIVDGMWIFRVKWPPRSPPAFKARYIARGFSQRQGVDYFHTFSPTPKMTTLWMLIHVAAQRDYELHSLDFSTAFLHGSLHEEIWTTLAALGFAPTTADPSLFLRTDTSLPPFYVLVYIDDLVFATADTEALTLLKSELQKRHTCTDLGELRIYLGLQITRDRARRTIALTQSHMVHQVLQSFGFQFSSPQPTPLSTSHLLSAPPSDESIKPSCPYPELVGCLMVLRYVCSTLGMGLVLGGRGLVVLTSHADASWVDDSATQQTSQGYTFSLGSGSVSLRSTRSSAVLSSSYEAEVYAGAIAAQELRWLTYLVSDLGEQPRSPPVLYVDNKAMIALFQEHRLEHRTKHITLRYFLARELQHRGQLRLAYVATRANTADVFTKALPPGDHQRFATVLGLVPTLPHLLSA